jgi:hypothetical protein
MGLESGMGFHFSFANFPGFRASHCRCCDLMTRVS